MSSESCLQHMDSSSPGILLFHRRAVCSGLTLIGILLTLAGGEGQGAMFYFVMEACKSRLLGQRPLSCEPLVIPTAGDHIYSRVLQLTDETATSEAAVHTSCYNTSP
jgi:hypothetical protein